MNFHDHTRTEALRTLLFSAAISVSQCVGKQWDKTGVFLCQRNFGDKSRAGIEGYL